MPLLFPSVLGVYQYRDTRIFLGPQQRTPRHAISIFPNDSESPIMVGIHTHNSRTTTWLGSVRKFRPEDNHHLVLSANSPSGPRLGTADLQISEGRYKFSVDLAHLERQTFEWRRSYGREVAQLNGGPGNGWKLVWKHAEGAETRHDTSPSWFGGSSDGGEVVAVCRVSSSGGKILRFRFLGSGDHGGLGGKWEVMAVLSALTIYRTLNPP